MPRTRTRPTAGIRRTSHRVHEARRQRARDALRGETVRRLRALLYKEWRDQRALVVGTLVLCVLLIVFGRILGGKRFDAELRSLILAGCLGLFAILLATE